GIIYFGFIGYKFLPEGRKSFQSDDVFDENIDYSNVPRWKQIMASIVLIATILAMILEDQIGVDLYISAWIGALILMASRIITEKNAMRSIDMNTILLFVGSLALAKGMEESGAGELIADTVIGALGNNPSPLLLLFVILVLSAAMTNFMSNTATTA